MPGSGKSLPNLKLKRWLLRQIPAGKDRINKPALLSEFAAVAKTYVDGRSVRGWFNQLIQELASEGFVEIVRGGPSGSLHRKVRLQSKLLNEKGRRNGGGFDQRTVNRTEDKRSGGQTKFVVHGPFIISPTQGKSGRTINQKNAAEFWELNHDAKDLADARGCYVFAVKTKAIVPWYIGSTIRNTFKGEIFGSHQRSKYHEALCESGKGKPVMFFLEAPRKRGRVNRLHINELEVFLIQTARSLNSKLLNIKGAKGPQWIIDGVSNARRGPSPQEISDFLKMLPSLKKGRS